MTRQSPHRIIAAQKLGRSLRPGEVVHHRNGNHDDNEPRNLRVFPSSSAHIRHHWRRKRVRFFVRYARFVSVVTGRSFNEVFESVLEQHA